MGQEPDILELFHAVADLPADEQSAMLDARCPPGSDSRRRIERLLSIDRARSGSDLESPVAGLAPEPSNLIGEVFAGKYRILNLIGAGGMGVVYLAEQDKPRRQLALKLIRPGLAGERQLRRFELEAEVLARLQHPGIASIYDAGAADVHGSPCPFLAMEYVSGLPLLEHVRRHTPPTRQLLVLMAQICDAVDHAHQRGVIHRDLKPGNIVVDASGQPRILDFGVARAVEPDLQWTTLQTGSGQLLGTLAYMSPEQVQGRSDDIDVRSDVYALGVVMYQLLAGKLPYDVGDRSIVAAARVIAEQDAESLSSVRREYRGDIDTIVRKALEKEPKHRYQSAAALGDDIRRYLSHEPIVARPATTVYQLRKFARRHPALVAGVAATIAVLAAGVAVSTTFALGQTRALAESERQRAIADAVNGFLTEDLIELADPQVEADRAITLAAALDRAAARIEGRFASAPIAEANLRLTIGRAYRHLHRLDEAAANFDRSLALFRAERPDTDEDVLLCRMELAAVLMARADFDAAEPEMRRLLATQRASLGDDHVQTMASLNSLGAALLSKGRFKDSEPLLDEALERRRRVLGEENRHTATTMNNLGVLYVYTGRFKDAESLLPRTLDILRELCGERHPQTLQTMTNLGITLHRLGRIDDAVAMLEQALPLHKEVLGPAHRSTLQVASSLATLYSMKGDNDRSESLLTETLEVQTRLLGSNHLDTLVTRMNLAKTAYDRRDYESALAEYAVLTGLFAEHYPDHFLGAIVRTMQGRCLMELSRFEDAESCFKAALEKIVSTLGPSHAHGREIARTLADLYTRWNRPADAQRWRAQSAGEPKPAD